MSDPDHSSDQNPAAQAAGFRFGEKGTHTSRTMMLAELTEVLEILPADATRDEYAEAIIESNVLGKQTTSTRRLWDVDEPGRPLIALLCALARDPLLRATSKAVLPMPIRDERIPVV